MITVVNINTGTNYMAQLHQTTVTNIGPRHFFSTCIVLFPAKGPSEHLSVSHSTLLQQGLTAPHELKVSMLECEGTADEGKLMEDRSLFSYGAHIKNIYARMHPTLTQQASKFAYRHKGHAAAEIVQHVQAAFIHIRAPPHGRGRLHDSRSLAYPAVHNLLQATPTLLLLPRDEAHFTQ
jgi:hypothetical protein